MINEEWKKSGIDTFLKHNDVVLNAMIVSLECDILLSLWNAIFCCRKKELNPFERDILL